MGKSTISMAIFNSKLLVYQRVQALPIAIDPPFGSVSLVTKYRTFDGHVCGAGDAGVQSPGPAGHSP